MIAMLAEGRGWRESLEIANRAAGICVQRRGGAQGPTRAELGL
jgi:sugar/nucleoside kinase (ribokinase family)